MRTGLIALQQLAPVYSTDNVVTYFDPSLTAILASGTRLSPINHSE